MKKNLVEIVPVRKGGKKFFQKVFTNGNLFLTIPPTLEKQAPTKQGTEQ